MLVDDHACTEARSTVTPQGADVAGGEHDSNTPSEAADHEQRRKGKKKKAKVMLRGGEGVRRCSCPMHWTAVAGMVAHMLLIMLAAEQQPGMQHEFALQSAAGIDTRILICHSACASYLWDSSCISCLTPTIHVAAAGEVP